MIEFFKKQSTLVKVLIIAVVIVIIGFIVQQIYKRFIKNAILRELYEDIKIVVESTCPAGYVTNSVKQSCEICLVPTYTTTDGISPCNTADKCDINEGRYVLSTKVVGGTDNGKVAGTGCAVCSNSSPDPNPDYPTTNITTSVTSVQNPRTNCISIASETNSPTQNISSLTVPSLISHTIVTQSNPGNYSKLFALSCNTAVGQSMIISSPTTTQPPSGSETITGSKTYTLKIEGINVLNDARTSGFNITTGYTNQTATNVWKYINFLFNQTNNNRNTLQIYFRNLIQTAFGQIVTGDIALDSITFLSDNTTTANTSSWNPQTIPNWKPAFIRIPVTWTCNGSTTYDPLTANGTPQCFIENGKTLINKTISYPSYSNLSPSEWQSLCPTVSIPKTNCPSTTDRDCIIDKKNVNTIKNIMSYNSTDKSYTYTNTYTFNILQYGLNNGKLCNDLTKTIYEIQNTDNTFTQLNPTQKELTINTSLNTATITRTCTIKYGDTIFVAVPGNYAGITKIPDANIYKNPTDYDSRFPGRFLLYKSISGSPTDISGPAKSTSCEAASNSLEVLSILSATTPSQDQYSSGTRTTVINARRNVYEAITVDTTKETITIGSNKVANPAYIRDKLKFMLGNINTIFASEDVITNISLASSAYTIGGTTPTTTDAISTSPLSPLTVPSALSIFTPLTVASSIVNKVSTIAVPHNNPSTSAAVIQDTGLYSLSNPNTQTASNVVGTSQTISGILNSSKWAWIASNDGSTTITGGNRRTALIYNGSLFTSYNSGNNWTNANILDNWSEVCMSQDGLIQFAISNPGYIYYSINAGLNWTRIPNSIINSLTTTFSTVSTISGSTSAPLPTDSIQSWTSIDCSSNGTIFAVTSQSGKIYRGTLATSGTTTNVTLPNTTETIAVSPNCTVQMALSSGYPTTIASNWKSISISANGSVQVAVINGAYLALSTDSGANWSFPQTTAAGSNDFGINYGVSPFKKWVDCKVVRTTGNDDGKYIVAIESTRSSVGQSPDGIGIYFSKDKGLTWDYIPNNLVSNFPTVTLCNVQTDSSRNIYVSTQSGTVIRMGPIPV